MVYIRSKQVKGIEYAYLVKSEWDNRNKTAKQVTIKYLGRASDVGLEDIPSIYRSDSRIISFLSAHNPDDMGKKSKMIESFRGRLFNYLSSGDPTSAFQLYGETEKVLSLADFYDKILRTVLHDIGSKWEKGELDVTTEHIASNTARVLISSIMMSIEKEANGDPERNSMKKKKKMKDDVIFICCPEGELHHTSALVLESVLRRRGYRVINASPSSPSGSILHYIDDLKPDLIMVSVTLPDNIGAAKRLVTEISNMVDRNQVSIIAGGSAFRNFAGDFPNVTAISPVDATLEDIVRLVRSSLRQSREKN